MKILRPSCLLFLLFTLTAMPLFAEIAIVKTGNAYDDVLNGFSSICFENQKEFTLLEDSSNKTELGDGLKAGGYTLVVAFGPQAALFARQTLPDAALVFAMVVNPDKIGLSGDKITGVSLNVPLLEQFNILKNISKKIKRVGVIYTQDVNDQLISNARDAATNQNLSLVASAINSSQDIQRAMSDLAGKIDALWIPPDPSLNSDEVVKYIGSTSLSKLIPCVGPSERFVRAGAIVAMAIDPVEAGRSAGDLANKILAGTPPSKLPVIEQKKTKIIINIKAANLLGVTIPKNVQDAASKIYQ